MEVTDLAWGVATVEFRNDDRRIGLHVFNNRLDTDDCVKRSIRFALARLRWFERQLPGGYAQWVAFDDRGQQLSDATRETLVAALSLKAERIAFWTTGLPRP